MLLTTRRCTDSTEIVRVAARNQTWGLYPKNCKDPKRTNNCALNIPCTAFKVDSLFLQALVNSFVPLLSFLVHCLPRSYRLNAASFSHNGVLRIYPRKQQSSKIPSPRYATHKPTILMQDALSYLFHTYLAIYRYCVLEHCSSFILILDVTRLLLSESG